MPNVHKLTPIEAAKVLWSLTRANRVTHLEMTLEQHPGGVLLSTPISRMLITSTPEATKHVLVRHHDRYQKGLGQSHARQLIGEGLLTAEGDRWHRQRADTNPLLRARTIEPLQHQIANFAVESVTSLLDDTTHIEGALANYTLKCLAHTMGFATPDGDRVHAAFDAVQDEALFRSITQNALPMRLRPRRRRLIHQALNSLADEATRSLDDQGRQESWATTEGMTSLFLAGYETTASTLAWAVALLASRPHAQEHIRAEAEREAATSTDQDSINSLRWTNATFKETLRLRPPVWLISREVTAPDYVSGIALQPGDEVLILPSVAARRGWRDPDSFRPVRFLEPTTGPAMWFGAGPRACPGGSLAQTEGVLWLSEMCRRAEFRIRPGTSLTPLARMSQAPAQPLNQLLTVIPRHQTSTHPAA